MIRMYKLIFKDKLKKNLTNIKTYGSIILRIEFSIELQKEMLGKLEFRALLTGWKARDNRQTNKNLD